MKTAMNNFITTKGEECKPQMYVSMAQAMVEMPMQRLVAEKKRPLGFEELKREVFALKEDEEPDGYANYFPNQVEKLMYLMYPDDYTCSFRIDGIGVDTNGAKWAIIGLDKTSPHPTLINVDIDTNGGLLQPDDHSLFRDPMAARLAAQKGLIREKLYEICKCNTIINDICVCSQYSYRERESAWEKRERLFAEVWELYVKNNNNKTKTNNMDKDLIGKTLNGANITVQGDFVMEKHVEHEIGNVEAGGVGIQIFNGDDKQHAIRGNEQRTFRGGGLRPPQHPAATLSPTRRDSLSRLLAIMDRAPWRSPATARSVRRFLLTVLAAEGGTPLTSSEDMELSEKMWRLMEQGRGDRTQIVAMNLAGYFVGRGLLPNGSPALAKAMFGKNTDAKYSNIDKGNPDCQSLSKGFAEIVPLLERHLPLAQNKSE